MRKPVTALLLMFLIVMCALAGCSFPIGSIYGVNEGEYETDPMWLIPRRVLYQIDERFMCYQDFQIFIVENNAVKEVSAYSQGVSVELVTNRDLSNEMRYPVLTAYHDFFTVGRYDVDVTYKGRKGWYAVEVFSPNNGNGIGGDGGIGIIWAD